MRKRRSRRLRLANNTEAWHAEMGAAPDPAGYIARRGFRSWNALKAELMDRMRRWESLPERVRVGYAFPNPEDR